MAARDEMPGAQRVLASILLGILIVAIAGVGVSRLYQSPVQSDVQLRKLNDEQRALDTSRRLVGKMSGNHEAYFNKVTAEIAAKKKSLQSGSEDWHRHSSIILVALGALFMGLSFIRAERLQAIQDGLFLGGLFTICYGVVWAFAGGPATTGFVVLAVAIGVLFAFGYLRFAEWRKAGKARPVHQELTPPPSA